MYRRTVIRPVFLSENKVRSIYVLYRTLNFTITVFFQNKYVAALSIAFLDITQFDEKLKQNCFPASKKIADVCLRIIIYLAFSGRQPKPVDGH